MVGKVTEINKAVLLYILNIDIHIIYNQEVGVCFPYFHVNINVKLFFVYAWYQFKWYAVFADNAPTYNQAIESWLYNGYGIMSYD